VSEQEYTSESVEELHAHIQKAILDMLQADQTPIVVHTDDGWKAITEATLKIWNSLPIDDPRKQLQIEAMPMTEGDRRERRAPTIRISGPRWVMEQLFAPEYFEPPHISISVTVEK
jgi:hypothetical protein